MYELVLTRKAQKFYEQAEDDLTRRLNRCFEQLCQNPYEHPNIKPLKGRFTGCWRYRTGDWRVIYRVVEETIQKTEADLEDTDTDQTSKSVITVLVIAHRREVYR